jgi:hypothetical protein
MFRSRSALTATAAAAAAALGAAAISACGSSSPQKTTSSSAGPTQAQLQRFQTDAVKFTTCIRNHGVSNFPDAPGPGGAAGRTWKNAFQNTSPAFVSARAACQHFLPTNGSSQSSAPSHRQIGAMLAFARCLRAHGFNRFPDPNGNGITHEMLAAVGIDLHQPALVRAADACVGVTHGAISRALVARFIAGH